MRIDLLELLAIALLVVAVFVAARTWGRVTVPISVILFVLALAQALWVLGVLTIWAVRCAHLGAVLVYQLLLLYRFATGGDFRVGLKALVKAA